MLKHLPQWNKSGNPLVGSDPIEPWKVVRSPNVCPNFRSRINGVTTSSEDVSSSDVVEPYGDTKGKDVADRLWRWCGGRDM